MDSATKKFMKLHADKLGNSVLEIGSYNVNGGLRDVINITVGIDMRPGTGVDIVCSSDDLKSQFEDGLFDSCVSAGTLEHVQNWKSFIKNSWDVVKENGYIVMTMASRSKGRHNYPNDYWRMSLDQIKLIYPRAEWVGNVGPVSIGWIVKKEGELGSMDFEPYKVA